ncbi:MAG: HEAT repeat domain-containing protein [Candidatus Cloacimonetes bacterium]|nr:HEAT repeat domain-containing protein [Candidatus Cloacimonadota bacterium]
MRNILCLAAFLACMCLLGSEALLSPAETRILEEMLAEAAFEPSAPAFEKDWDLSTKYKLDWQLRQLQDPWRGLEDMQELRETCCLDGPEALPALLRQLGGIAFNLDPGLFASLYPASRSLFDQQLAAQVRKPEDIFAWLESGLDYLATGFQPAFAAFSPEEKRMLLSFWHWQFIESEDIDKYEACYEEKGLPAYSELDQEEVQNLLGQFDPQALLSSGIQFLALSDALLERVQGLTFKSKKILSRKTRHGLMAVGTPGDDVYDAKGFKDICLLLDPAGNDRYETSLATGPQNSFCLLIDLAGDDLYRNPEPAALFHSSFGLGCSYDLDGDDIYQTDDFSFSAFMGLNLHQDLAGNDSYRSGLFAQGAAMCGTALMLDAAGNDSYQASVAAQGFGSTHGVGALLDRGGADIYSLGGKYFHEPLMPLDYITLGQGMGLGLRPDLAGGLGLLYDGAGNDRYLGGVYAQGSGYWYATGALIDEGGNDIYSAVYYPQGSGIHLACGWLLDSMGDDAYYSRHGPGQGAGHDWSLGVLIDGAGNDAYSIEGGNGLGLTNSVGLFVDKSGNDRYERINPQNYGGANLARSAGGIGLFLDAGGSDSYPDSLKANNKTWQSGTYGIGRDLDLNLIAKSAVEELAENAAMPDSTDSIESIFSAASEWEVGSAVQRVRAAREILLSRAGEAIPYVLENKLNTASGLEYRALAALAGASPEFIAELYQVIELPDSLAAKNALSLISGVGDSLLVEPVERLLQDKKYETACISVLAGVHSERSVELLNAYIVHPSERFRYLAARSLKQIKHPSARATLELMRPDRSFLVQSLLRNLPPEEKP